MSRTIKRRDKKRTKRSRNPQGEQEGKYIPRKRANRFKGKQDYWDD